MDYFPGHMGEIKHFYPPHWQRRRRRCEPSVNSTPGHWAVPVGRNQYRYQYDLCCLSGSIVFSLSIWRPKAIEVDELYLSHFINTNILKGLLSPTKRSILELCSERPGFATLPLQLSSSLIPCMFPFPLKQSFVGQTFFCFFLVSGTGCLPHPEIAEKLHLSTLNLFPIPSEMKFL